jgi:hypothetical protein
VAPEPDIDKSHFVINGCAITSIETRKENVNNSLVKLFIAGIFR